MFVFRRLHQGNTTWHGTTTMPVVQGVQTKQNPDRLKGTTCDLFELLEKAQSSRLDDQRCVLPAYFNQVILFFTKCYLKVRKAVLRVILKKNNLNKIKLKDIKKKKILWHVLEAI